MGGRRINTSSILLDLYSTIHISLSDRFYYLYAMKEIISCPYPDHPGYVAVWDSLTSEDQKRMAENIHITADHKVEVVPLHKKFSLLSAEHNGVDIFSGDFKDVAGKQWKEGATYFSVDAAQRECAIQWKQLMWPYKKDMEEFIMPFPGQNDVEKMRTIIRLFDLNDIGWLDFFNDYKRHIHEIGYVWLTSRDGIWRSGKMERSSWGSDYPHIGLAGGDWFRPFMVSEKC